MNPYAILAALALCAVLTASAYFKGASDNEADHVEAERNSLLAYASRISEGVEQHDKDRQTIADLKRTADKLRVHIPTCPAKDSDGAAGLLSNRVDEEFGKLQARAGELFERCDRLNIDAIRLNTMLE